MFESKYLSINSKKVFKILNWAPFLSIETAVDLAIDWYRAFKNRDNLFQITKDQIKTYLLKL